MFLRSDNAAGSVSVIVTMAIRFPRTAVGPSVGGDAVCEALYFSIVAFTFAPNAVGSVAPPDAVELPGAAEPAGPADPAGARDPVAPVPPVLSDCADDEHAAVTNTTIVVARVVAVRTNAR